MTTAFQPDGFQGQGFQIGAEATSIVVDEVIPQIAATITTIIAVSGWVFAGTPPPPAAFVNYDSPLPPVRAPVRQIRPYEDTYYRFANSQQSVIGIDSEARRPVPPRINPRPEIDTYYRYANNQQSTFDMDSDARLSVPPRPVRRSADDTFVPAATAATYDYGWTPPPVPKRQVPRTPNANPGWDYGATPVTPPIVIDELVPYQVAGVSNIILIPPSVFIPAAAAPATYPVALAEPARPKPPVPRPSLRNDLTGTVGVFFYEISQPFDWGNSSSRQTPRLAASRRFESDVYIAPATPAVFPIGLIEPARPRYPLFRSPRFDADPFMPAVVTPTYDYGWYSEPQRPTQLKPPYARNLTPDTIYPVAGSTADYGWYAAPRLPVQQKPSSGIYLTPDTFIIVAGATPDYGWYSEPQRPVQLKPPNGINLIPDYWPWELTPIVEEHPHFGGWPHKKGGHLKKKKRKEIPAFEDRLPTARQTLLQVLADIQERQDEEDILMILKKIYDS